MITARKSGRERVGRMTKSKYDNENKNLPKNCSLGSVFDILIVYLSVKIAKLNSGVGNGVSGFACLFYSPLFFQL